MAPLNTNSLPPSPCCLGCHNGERNSASHLPPLNPGTDASLVSVPATHNNNTLSEGSEIPPVSSPWPNSGTEALLVSVPNNPN